MTLSQTCGKSQRLANVGLFQVGEVGEQLLDGAPGSQGLVDAEALNFLNRGFPFMRVNQTIRLAISYQHGEQARLSAGGGPSSRAPGMRSCGRGHGVEDQIIVGPQILTGKPVVRGTRISVEVVVELLAAGWSHPQILALRVRP